jgi:hypothetical protein
MMKGLIPCPGIQGSKARGWAALLAVIAVWWVFAVWLGPWMANHIPVFDRIVHTIENRDIHAGAYFYTEISAVYEGERYLKNALQPQASRQDRTTLLSCAGVMMCIGLLVLGYYYLPDD